MINRPKAIIFDMDGLLINSEPLWVEAEKQVLAKVGVDLSEKMALETRGLREDEVIDYWYKKFKWKNLSKDEVSAEILDRISELIREQCEMLPGAQAAIALARKMNCKTALASSSHMSVIKTVINKFKLNDFDCVHSAEHEAKGKPDPAVYLSVCRKLQVDSGDCLALEDSANGLKAAKAAGMCCIAVPALEERNDERFKIADRIIGSLEELNQDLILSLFNN